MNIYLIRLENGDLEIITAENEEQALSEAGLDEKAMEGLPDLTPEEGFGLMQSGIGPQRYHIKQLHQLCMVLRLNDRADFEVEDIGEESLEDFRAEYPAVQAVLNDSRLDALAVRRDLEALDREVLRGMRQAVEHERTRLTLPKE